MQTVGVRELKNRLTRYLADVRNGDEVVVTDRGRPFAILHRLDRDEKGAGLEERLATLAAQGVLRYSASKMALPDFEPLKLEGEPVSETLIRERR